MKYLLILLLKIAYSIWYLIRIAFQFLWELDIRTVDFKSATLSWEHEEYEGYYCKHIFDMWANKYSQSEEVRLKWENERDRRSHY